MANQTIAKPLGLIRDLNTFIHGIPYKVTFTIINSNVLDFSCSMLLGRPWLRDAKISHNLGTNIVTIQRTSTMRTILVTKKLNVESKRPKVLVCYDFHSETFNEKEDMMFPIKLDLFLIGTIAISTHIKLVLN
jgi:hypothetical protein